MHSPHRALFRRRRGGSSDQLGGAHDESGEGRLLGMDRGFRPHLDRRGGEHRGRARRGHMGTGHPADPEGGGRRQPADLDSDLDPTGRMRRLRRRRVADGGASAGASYNDHLDGRSADLDLDQGSTRPQSDIAFRRQRQRRGGEGNTGQEDEDNGLMRRRTLLNSTSDGPDPDQRAYGKPEGRRRTLSSASMSSRGEGNARGGGPFLVDERFNPLKPGGLSNKASWDR